MKAPVMCRPPTPSATMTGGPGVGMGRTSSGSQIRWNKASFTDN